MKNETMKLKMKHRTAMFQRINTLIINSLDTKNET